ncbi:MAG: hypothetical protein ACK4EX_00940 [Thermaurantimonas sp.]
MEIIALLAAIFFYVVAGVIVGLLIIYLIINRIREKRKEDFEHRDN